MEKSQAHNFLAEYVNKNIIQDIKAALYIVSTPIGNVHDITLRALKILNDSDFILVEDTRCAFKLLDFYGIKSKLIIYNEQSSYADRMSIISKIKEGQVISLISDAGTPLISDPGYKLISEIIAAGILIYSVPGASAVMCALTSSGLATDKFVFLGFWPRKLSSAISVFNCYINLPLTLIYYESSRRLIETLKLILKLQPKANIVIARELTKLYEEIFRGNIAEVIDCVAGKKIRGEVVLLVEYDREKDPNYLTNQEQSLDQFLLKNMHLRSKDLKNDASVAFPQFSKTLIYDKITNLKK